MQSELQEGRIPPFRSMNDFITNATWNIPNFSDVERFNNRVINNLIYYQTNYFVFGIGLMFLIGIIHLKELFTGVAVIIGILFANPIISKVLKSFDSTTLYRHRNNTNVIHLITICVVIYLVLSFIQSLLYLILNILFPILCILIHAMLRKRNIANKVTNKLEKIKLDQTPMAKFLEAMDLYN